MVESARGKALGQVDALLVDCPWGALTFLRRASSLRGEAGQQLKKFMYEGHPCRPSRDGAQFAAESWIAEHMDEETAGEYASCEEVIDEELQRALAESAALDGAPMTETEALQARVQEL